MNRKIKSQYKVAVGLRYDAGQEEVPTLNINGQHLLADQLVKIARRYGIPVVERADLARALNLMQVDSSIPEHLFEAVATVLNEIEKNAAKRVV